MHHAVEDMKEDWRLLEKHIPKWRAAISEFVPLMHATDQPHLVLGALLDTLVRAEPEAEVKGCVLVQHGDPNHPSEPASHLLVESATRETASAREKQGALWHHSSKAAVSVDAFATLESNVPILRSPHGTVRHARRAAAVRARSPPLLAQAPIPSPSTPPFRLPRGKRRWRGAGCAPPPRPRHRAHRPSRR